MKNKIYVTLLSLIMMMTMMPLSTFADTEQSSAKNDNNYTSTVEYTCNMNEQGCSEGEELLDVKQLKTNPLHDDISIFGFKGLMYDSPSFSVDNDTTGTTFDDATNCFGINIRPGSNLKLEKIIVNALVPKEGGEMWLSHKPANLSELLDDGWWLAKSDVYRDYDMRPMRQTEDGNYCIWFDGIGKVQIKSIKLLVAQKYQVSFEMNGYGTQIPPQEIDKGEKVIKPKDPTASGCEFGGWYTNSKCTGKQFDFNTPITKDIKLYAKWTVIPQKITGFEAYAPTCNQAKVVWDKINNPEIVYFLYKGDKPTGQWGDKIAVLSNNVTHYIDKKVTTGKKAYYMMRSAVKQQDGSYEFGPYTKIDYAYPRIPDVKGFETWAPNAKCTAINFVPLANKNIKYWIYRGTKPYGDWGSPIAKIDGKNLPYVDKKVKSGHKYYYMLRPVEVVNGKTYFGQYTKMDYAYPR